MRRVRARVGTVIIAVGVIACSDPGAVAIVPIPSRSGEVIDISAKDREFSVREISVHAGSAFTIRFDNEDAYKHAIYITAGERETTFEAGLAGPSVFKGDYFSGPASLTYDVAGLAAGTYLFFCPVHPAMTGTLQVN